MTKKPDKTLKKAKEKQQGEDAGLWGHVASGITPLPGRHKNLATDAPAAPPPPKAKPAREGKKPAAAPPSTDKKPAPLPDLTHNAHPGLDKGSAKRLKDGKRPIEARLDLHGMTQDQAHRALDAFIDASAHAGRRCVLVITGKGGSRGAGGDGYSDGSIGVLREQVPRWLNQATLRPLILAFSHARPKDGGEGALYVLLKRNR